MFCILFSVKLAYYTFIRAFCLLLFCFILHRSKNIFSHHLQNDDCIFVFFHSCNLSFTFQATVLNQTKNKLLTKHASYDKLATYIWCRRYLKKNNNLFLFCCTSISLRTLIGLRLFYITSDAKSCLINTITCKLLNILNRSEANEDYEMTLYFSFKKTVNILLMIVK